MVFIVENHNKLTRWYQIKIMIATKFQFKYIRRWEKYEAITLPKDPNFQAIYIQIFTIFKLLWNLYCFHFKFLQFTSINS